ncbi:MAG TPA: hypothetical protein VF043_23680 [Ktedonobacteraceae bacterium]
MRPVSGNGNSEVEQVLTELLQKASSSKVLGAVRSMSKKMLEAARDRIRRSYPNASDEEIAVMLLERYYGKGMADRFRMEIQKRRSR